jgi:hypothetical protein
LPFTGDLTFVWSHDSDEERGHAAPYFGMVPSLEPAVQPAKRLRGAGRADLRIDDDYSCY